MSAWAPILMVQTCRMEWKIVRNCLKLPKRCSEKAIPKMTFGRFLEETRCASWNKPSASAGNCRDNRSSCLLEKIRGGMLRTILTTGLCVSTFLLLAAGVTADDISARARKLHFLSIVVDTHDDTTQRFLDGKFDLGPHDVRGSIDIPRMKEGGLSAIFFSI